MVLQLSCEEARRFLALYHLTPTSIAGTIERLGTVQYDPLNPVGRNPDLVFQARVPGYRVDDWQQAAYTDRIVYDAWDKQACLVPVSDWPMRALIREKYRPYHDREILQAEAEAAAAVLAEINLRGPLSSQDFEDKQRAGDNNSWYGQSRVKRILRSLWASGLLLTHHRQAGRHYYDLPQRVIPDYYFQAEPLLDEDLYHRWILSKRIQAMGLMPRTAEASIWAGCGGSKQMNTAREELLEAGVIMPVQVGEKAAPYYMLAASLTLLNQQPCQPRVHFLGPLDSMLWDRKTLRYIFDFDYVWEVYKPEKDRRWGYYVLPVFYGDGFVARLDSRLEKGVWTISRWWWEADISPDEKLLCALQSGVKQFLSYLSAQDVRVSDAVDEVTRLAIEGWLK